MADKTPEQLQAEANTQAAEIYKQAVGGKFTDGIKTASVKSYVPSRLHGKEARQCFLVNYGHPNVSFFEPCKEFMERFKPVSNDNPEPAPTDNNLPQ